MAQNRDNEYYKMFVKMGAYARQIAKELQQVLEGFEPKVLPQKMEELHAIEQAADEVRHELHRKLAKEFIAPLERGDILSLIGQLDEVVDGIEDILLKVYMFGVQTILPDATEFAGVIVRCCNELGTILDEFANFKKSKLIFKSIVEVNRLEEVGDRLFMQAMRNLYQSERGPREITAWTEIYTQMEACCDNCEHTANLVEEVMMKNM